MRRLLAFIIVGFTGLALATLFGCDQLNKPMPVSTFGTSASSSGASAADAGSSDDAALPRAPGDAPLLTPQPGDVQL